MSVWMLLSLSHLSLSPTFTFYHRGNWPISLLVVGGSGGGCCASGVCYCIVWFYGCLIAPYCLLVVNKRHSKGFRLLESLSSLTSFLSVSFSFCDQLCLSHGHGLFSESEQILLFSSSPSADMISKYNFCIYWPMCSVNSALIICFRWSRNSSRGFPNFFSHQGHTVVYLLSQEKPGAEGILLVRYDLLQQSDLLLLHSVTFDYNQSKAILQVWVIVLAWPFNSNSLNIDLHLSIFQIGIHKT